MKKLIVALAALLFFACQKEDSPIVPVLEVVDKIDFKNIAESRIVDVETNIEDWTFAIDAPAKNWCFAEKQKNKLQVTVTKNENMELRTTEITVYAADIYKKIKITQLGEAPGILVYKQEYSVYGRDTILDIIVTSNIDYDVIIDKNWIKQLSVRKMENETLKFQIQRNETKEKRIGAIEFKQTTGGDVSTSITITQAARDTTYNPGTIGEINDIKIPVSTATASSAQSDGHVSNSYDNNMGTLYHSSWNNTEFPVKLEYFFDGTEPIDYMVYYPRTIGSNGNFKKLEVWVSTETNPSAVKYGEYDFNGSGSPSSISFSGGITKPKFVRIVVNSGEGGFASCAEMEFYRKNTKDVPIGVFTDNTFSDLFQSVTIDNIDTISNSFYRTLARSIFLNEYPKEFRVQNYKPFPHPSIKATENKTSPYSLLDNPTGICVQNNEDLVVFVGNTKGNNISLRVIDFDKGYNGTSYALIEGVNKLKTTGAGLAYIMYHTENPLAEPIKVHIASGTVNGYFERGKHNASDWSRLINAAKEKHFDVVGNYAHLAFPVSSLKKSDGPKLIETFDSISWLEQDFLGLNKYNRFNKNRSFLHVVYKKNEANAHMYATSYRTAYEEGTLSALCDYNRLKTTEIWGPAHELGHCNQTRPGFKWVGMTEVSNNLYSLYVQSSFGNPTRLQSESLGSYSNRYEKAFNMFVNDSIHGTYSDVFCKLIPFWQLQLYYAKIKNYPDFYKDLHEQVRTQPDPANSGVAQLNFIKICCDLVKEDLTDFFTSWGMLSPIDKEIDDYGKSRLTCTQAQIDEVKAYIQKYPKPAYNFTYLHDECLDAFEGNAIVKGSSSVSGSGFSFPSWKNVVVFEVYNSANELVFVSPKTNFKTTSSISSPTVYAVAADGSKIKAY